MAKLDQLNHATFWTDPHLGVNLLRADYSTLSFAPHVHEEIVIAVTERGVGRFISRHVSDVAAPRSILFFNPGEPHEGGAAEGVGWQYRALYIDVPVFTSFQERINGDRSSMPYFKNNNVPDAGLADFILKLHQSLETGGPRLEQESLFLNALASLLCRHSTPKMKLRPLGTEQQPMSRVRDYMAANLHVDLGVADLAAIARVSQFHFIRAFRKEVGLSPHAYLNQLRLFEARRLIAEGTALADVATEVGFYDQSHLIRRFKRAYGITPGQYAAARDLRGIQR